MSPRWRTSLLFGLSSSLACVNSDSNLVCPVTDTMAAIVKLARLALARLGRDVANQLNRELENDVDKAIKKVKNKLKKSFAKFGKYARRLKYRRRICYELLWPICNHTVWHFLFNYFDFIVDLLRFSMHNPNTPPHEMTPYVPYFPSVPNISSVL